LPFLLAVLTALFLLASAARVWSLTYYVDASSGKDTNTGLSGFAAWKTIAKVNASRFNPGDQIQFKRGEIWRETLVVPSSGSPGNPITFGAYGAGSMPKITGANLLSGWGVYKGSTFTATLPLQPNQVFMDSVRLIKGTSPDTLNDSEWFWTNGVLYLRNDMGNPDHAGKVIEASQRDYCVLVNYPGVKNFIVIDGLLIEKANSFGIFVGSALDGFVVSNSVMQSCYYDGLKATNGTRQDNGLIYGNIMRFNGRAGIIISGLANAWTIERNKSFDNCQINLDSHDWCAGVYMWGNNYSQPNRITDMVVQNNEIYQNGIVSPTTNRGVGVWLDDCGGGNIVRYNTIYGNNASGIYLEATSYSKVYYNLIYGNNGTNQVVGGIYVKGNVGRTASNNFVSNNTLYNNWNGIMVATYDPSAETTGQAANNLIINNISVGNVQELFAYLGGANNGINGAGNVYRYNCFGPERERFIYWGGSNYSSYQKWESISRDATHSVEADPKFINPSAGYFRLLGTSRCIKSGMDVGLKTDLMGNALPSGQPPDIGAIQCASEKISAPRGIHIPAPQSGRRDMP
jgi:parallel beta-helix repeat protein